MFRRRSRPTDTSRALIEQWRAQEREAEERRAREHEEERRRALEVPEAGLLSHWDAPLSDAERGTREAWREATTAGGGWQTGLPGIDAPQALAPGARPTVGDSLGAAIGLTPALTRPPAQTGREREELDFERLRREAEEEEEREIEREARAQSLAERLLRELEDEKVGLERFIDHRAELERDRARLRGDILEDAHARRERELEELERARRERELDELERDERERDAREQDERDREERERDEREQEERDREAREQEERDREEREAWR